MRHTPSATLVPNSLRSVTTWRCDGWKRRGRSRRRGVQVLLELQRDWTRHETYDGARAIVEAHGGGYGIGLAYAGDMIKPA